MKLNTKQEFELYALMYVAALDMKTSKEELKLMNAKGSEELIQNVAELFEEDNDAQRVETIMQATEKFLKTDEQKAEFMDNLKKLAETDTTVPIEIANLSILEKILIP